MLKLLLAMKWRIFGSYNPQGPVTVDIRERAQNRAKYEVWKFNTLGPGKKIYGSDYAYQIVDSRELSKEPLYINNPQYIAAMASIIAEMEGQKEIAFWTPRIMPIDRQSTLEQIAREEEAAIDHAVKHYKFNHDEFRKMLERLKQYHAS